MDAETLEALKGSIAKWEAIVAGTGEDEGRDNCPLCQKFCKNDGVTPSCEGCPVYAATGLKFCVETPYCEYSEAIDGERLISAQGLAVEELAFLKSLLPAEPPHER